MVWWYPVQTMNNWLPKSVILSGALGALSLLPVRLDAATVGEAAPQAKVVDVDDKALWTSDLKGSTAIVFYEDKDSGEVNRALKDELKSLMGEEGMGGIRVVPVADVSDYNSWPSRGFVKDAVRDESKKAGVTIYCDWDASYRKAFDLSKGTSNVVVVGRDGFVKVSTSGAIKEARRKAILEVLRNDVAKKD